MKIPHVGFTQLALATAITVTGCPSPAPVDGGFVDAPLAAPDTGPLCGEPAAFEIGSPEGHPSPLGAAAGEARAGRVTAADLPADPARLATWSAGDYVLANDRVALVVSSAEHFDVYDPHGGRVRGLARVEGGRLTAPADFNLAMLGLGRLVVGTTSVTVLHDGRDGAPATIRVAGTLVGIQALGPLLETLFVSRFEGLPVALDFVLEPDASMVDVRIALRTRGMQANVPFATTAFFQSFRMPVWNETGGFAAPTAPQRYMLFEDADASSFAWVAPANADGSAGSVSPLFSTGGFDFFSAPAGVVPPCTEQSFALGRFAIGDRNGMNGVQRVIAREFGESTRRIEGVLTSSDPLAIAGARVHLTRASDDAHLTRALVDATGAFDLVVPVGEVEAWVWREGVGLEGPFVVPPSGPVSIALAPTATVRVDVLDALSRNPLPARVQLFPWTGEPPASTPGFGERDLGQRRARLEFTPVDGHVDLRVAPGTYRLVVTHGWEMERHDQRLDLAAGDTVNVEAELARAFETPGLMCADYHIHTHRSVDSDDTGHAKMAALVADGLEIAIRSEHEWVSDFQPVIDDLGLDAFAVGFAGEELTTFTYGHFGVFPLEVQPSRPSAGAVTWFNRLAPDVFNEIRARPESPLLIINHPRAGGLKQGYFNEAGYDRVTGLVTHPENWDESFDVVEVFNAGDLERFRGTTVADWFSLLSAGRRVMTVGSSDSHHITEDPVGYPRTCLWVGEDDPRMLTGDRVRDVTRSGASFVTGGIYLEATGPSGIVPGGTATGVGARASIEVTLRAPSFIDVDQLEVIVNGITTETIPVPEGTDPVRFADTIEIDVPVAGAWVVFHASAATAPDVAYGGRPFAVSNPMFLRR
jgi:hypothetical protein